MKINDLPAPEVCGGNLSLLLPPSLQLHVSLRLRAPLDSQGAQIGREQLHDQRRDDNQHEDEVPGRHHGFVEVLVITGLGADAIIGAVAGEVDVEFGKGQLRQEEDHQADAQDAKPHGAALVGGGSVHCRAQDGDEACN